LNGTADFTQARQLFTSAPEGWYVVLKNPAEDGAHPEAAKSGQQSYSENWT